MKVVEAARRVGIVGGGPAGLIAAEMLAESGLEVTVHDRMRVVGRKFVMAGRGGLNLTNDEPLDTFVLKYGPAESVVAAVRAFPPRALRDWAAGLGQATFVGTSRRVFPESFHTTPLLRAWLERLHDCGVAFERGTFVGVTSSADGTVELELQVDGESTMYAYDVVVLALGGASWPRLGADGSWVAALRARGVEVRELAASNCGFEVAWSPEFARRFAGTPLKNIAIAVGHTTVRGEAMITETGIEGGVIYALGPSIRQAIAVGGVATMYVDLHPDVRLEQLWARLDKVPKSTSFATRLRKVGLSSVAASLVREALPAGTSRNRDLLAMTVKALPVDTHAPMPIARAISSVGGVVLDAADERFMLRALPGVFVAGEMLDFDAPTGGYLLQACFATGVAAARGVMAWASSRVPGLDPADEANKAERP